MTSLLEQAIIDASELKAVAIKNAENILLEKYSNELKETLSSLLEEPGEDPLASMMGGSPGNQMGGPENPLAQKMPMAATDGEKLCDCPENDEEIEINFDQLAQQMNGGAPMGGGMGISQTQDMNQPQMPGQMGELKPEDDQKVMGEGGEGGSSIHVPPQLGPELHTFSMSRNDPLYQVGSMAYANQPVPSSLLDQAISQLQQVSSQNNNGEFPSHGEQSKIVNLMKQLQTLSQPKQNTTMEGDYDQNLWEGLSEEDIKKIFESLEVDIKNVPLGHTGRASESERTEALAIELARQQDSKVKDEHEKLQKAYNALQETKIQLESDIKELVVENNNIKSIALQASGKLEELNLKNAKLLYENRALKSVSLNERQKGLLVEAISKVGSIDEIKNVFNTIQETSQIQEKRSPQTLREALDIKKGNILNISNKKTEKMVDPEKERYQRLAGITKK